jgi:hypothetical protein
MNAKDPIEYIETAWEYELAVELNWHGDRMGYFRSADDRVSHHTWFRIEPEQSRWAMVTESAVRNAIENNSDVRLREPDSLIDELESESESVVA